MCKLTEQDLEKPPLKAAAHSVLHFNLVLMVYVFPYSVCYILLWETSGTVVIVKYYFYIIFTIALCNLHKFLMVFLKLKSIYSTCLFFFSPCLLLELNLSQSLISPLKMPASWLKVANMKTNILHCTYKWNKQGPILNHYRCRFQSSATSRWLGG